MLSPVWLGENSFRVLRLSASATSADAHKAASSMRRMAVLTVISPTDEDHPALGPLQRTEASIRSALGRIESPSLRILDRLFWFHQGAAGDDTPTPATFQGPLQQAAALHDEALRALFRLYELNSDSINQQAWQEALRSWHSVVQSADYWRLSKTLESFGSFEPLATDEEFESLRRNAMLHAAEPLLTVSRSFTDLQDDHRMQASIQTLLALSETGDWVQEARAEIFQPFVEAVGRACEENRNEYGAKVIRENHASATNREPCDELLQHFREFVQPALSRLQQFAPRDQSEEVTARENVARCLSSVATAFTWSDQFVESERLFQEALSLADGTIAAVEIERSLQETKGAADKERRMAGLSPDLLARIETARSHVMTILNTGRSSLLREPEQSSHNKSVCDVMLGRFRTELRPMIAAIIADLPPQHLLVSELLADEALCLNAIATDYTWADEFVLALQLRQEALVTAANTDAAAAISEGISKISESARQERLFKELIPLKGTPPLSTINGIGGKLYGSSDHDPSTNSFATTYYFTLLFFPIIPLRRYRVIQEGNSYRFLGRLPLRKFDKWHLGIALAAILIAITIGASSSEGSTHATPSTSTPVALPTSDWSGTSDRQELKTEIENGRARMNALDSELNPVLEQMKQLKSEIDELDSQLKELDSQKESGTTIDIDDYNFKVNRYNALVSERKSLYNLHKDSIEEYKDLAKKDDELIGRYNALLK